MIDPELDQLGLRSCRRQTMIQIGGNCLNSAVVDGAVSSSAGQLPDAEIFLDHSRIMMPPDYFGTVVVVSEEASHRIPRFTGIVTKASVDAGRLTINANGALNLLDSPVGDGQYHISNTELIYVLARLGGFSDDEMDIDGLEDLQRETFQIVVPLDGIELHSSIDIGGVRFFPSSSKILSFLATVPSEIVREDFEASAYAMAYSTANLALKAEEEGLSEIDFALAWITTHLRYGFANLPNGSPIPFNRDESLAQVRRRDLVAVSSLASSRRWLRRPRSLEKERRAILGSETVRINRTCPKLTVQEKLAFLALRRATEEVEPLAQVQALFEAIEFYVSGVTVPTLFTKVDRRLIRKGIPNSLEKKQVERICKVLEGLNNSPLRIRLEHALRDDQVPITRHELDLLWQLRELRNNVVHGRSIDTPQSEDVDYATSIVARMLVHRVSANSRE